MTIESYTYKGNLYAIPCSVETSGTVYNEDLLNEAGAKLPSEYAETEWDWNTFIATAAKMVHGEGIEKVWGSEASPDVQSGLGDLAYSNGGAWLSDDGLESRVAEDAFVEAAEVCVGMVTKDKISPPPDALSAMDMSRYAAFLNQKLGFLIAGNFALTWVLKGMLEDKKFNVNFFTSPVSPKTKKVVGAGHSVGNYVWAEGPHLPEAMAFAKFLASKEHNKLVSANPDHPIISPRTDCQQEFWDTGMIPEGKREGLKRAFEVPIPYPHSPLLNASVAIGYVNTALKLAMNGDDDRPIRAILEECEEKINADLRKAASG